MCGIVGIISESNVVFDILKGLQRLEYRGYDSAGISFLDCDDKIKSIKREGKIKILEEALVNENPESFIGIGHTRWATHGRPSEINAHPHTSHCGKISVVHNGIIENFEEIKEELKSAGYEFKSETDTEVIPNLISHYLSQNGNDYIGVLRLVTEIMQGAYAIAVVVEGINDKMFVAKKGSPLMIGYGDKGVYVASSCGAISDLIDETISLQDGDIGVLSRDEAEIYDENSMKVNRVRNTVNKQMHEITKLHYPHFMLKEIHEQPQVVENIIKEYTDITTGDIHLSKFPFDIKKADHINIVACGTSYYAGYVAKYFLESMAKTHVSVQIASEFRYNSAPLKEDNVAIFISQSGETADTIASLKFAKEHNQKIVSLVNVTDSTIARLSDTIIKTIAGPEIGVASTKAFIAQVTILGLLAIKFAQEKGYLTQEEVVHEINALKNLPFKMQEILSNESINNIKNISNSIKKARHIMYVGRGISYPIALEGALKIKETSYIPTEGIAAGELKHGPIALIDGDTPVVAVAPFDELFEKTVSNVQEIYAREGQVVSITNRKGLKFLESISKFVIEIPEAHNMIESAILSTLPVQLLSYYTSVFLGNDVDQPRNLAKSVTVE